MSRLSVLDRCGLAELRWTSCRKGFNTAAEHDASGQGGKSDSQLFISVRVLHREGSSYNILAHWDIFF